MKPSTLMKMLVGRSPTICIWCRQEDRMIIVSTYAANGAQLDRELGPLTPEEFAENQAWQ